MTLDEIKALLDAASTTPWTLEYDKEMEEVLGISSLGENRDIVETDYGFYGPSLADATLIAAAPRIIDDLLTAIGGDCWFWTRGQETRTCEDVTTSQSEWCGFCRVKEEE